MTAPDASHRPLVLVAEDEALIRMLAHETLSNAGFHVIEAAHGGEALDILEARPEVSALFSDVDMPVMDGFSLARRIAMRWPHIPVLITSGKTSPGLGDLPAGARFLPKPYRPSALVNELNSLLRCRGEAECRHRARPFH
jgi:CheY-like chemotaxis protein